MPLLRNPDKSKICKRKNPTLASTGLPAARLPARGAAQLPRDARLHQAEPKDPSVAREIFTFEEFVEELDLTRIVARWAGVRSRQARQHQRPLLPRDALPRRRCSIRSRNGPLADETCADRAAGEEADRAGGAVHPGDRATSSPATSRSIPSRSRASGASLSWRRSSSSTPRRSTSRSTSRSAGLEAMTSSFTEENGWSKKDLFMAIRVAITGRDATPELFDVMHVLGRALVRRRLRWAIEAFKGARVNDKQRKDKEGSEAKKRRSRRRRSASSTQKSGACTGAARIGSAATGGEERAGDLERARAAEDHAMVIEGGKVGVDRSAGRVASEPKLGGSRGLRRRRIARSCPRWSTATRI